jgi:hypothetical protein
MLAQVGQCKRPWYQGRLSPSEFTAETRAKLSSSAWSAVGAPLAELREPRHV